LHILESINDNAYKVDLPGEYGVSAIFNVSNLTLFTISDDLRSNHFKERGDDEEQPNTKYNYANDPLEVLIWSITKARDGMTEDEVHHRRWNDNLSMV
jgi:purine-nucleoside phosphorylase